MNTDILMSTNDPRWGNRGSNGERGGNRGNEQGPPDLEEIWRDFNQRLSGIFGRRREGGPSGPGGPGRPGLPSFKQFGGGIGLLVLLVLVVWLGSGFYTVNTNERGVVLRLGEYKTVTEPGLNWRLPWPIETHEIVDLTGVRTVSVGSRDNNARALMLTDDLNIVAVQFAVQYVLKSEGGELGSVRKPEARSASEAKIDEPVDSEPVPVDEPKAEHGESGNDREIDSGDALEVVHEEPGNVHEPGFGNAPEVKRDESDDESDVVCEKVGVDLKDRLEARRDRSDGPRFASGDMPKVERDRPESGPRDFLFENRNPNEEFVRQIAETAMREIVGKSKMDFVLYEGRGEIAAVAKNLIQEILDRYKSGIEISRVTMEDAQPPDQVQAAFDDATRATQDCKRSINEGKAYRNDVVPKAEGAASRLKADAQAYSAREINKAMGETARFRQVLSEFKRAPQVTRERMYLETVQELLSNSSKVMIDNKSGSNLLYLPIDKLVQPGRGAPTAAGAAQQSEPAQSVLPQSPAPSSQGGPRERDFMRDRNRGDRG